MLDKLKNIGAATLILRRLDGIERQLKKLADLYELELAQRGYHLEPPKADTSGDEPVAMWTDEEQDYAREVADEMGRKVD